MLRRGILVGLVMLPFVVAGCGDDDDMMMTPTAEASLRVAHLSPDAPNVDVWLDGAIVPALTDVPFGAVSDYLTVPAGTYNVKVYATGTSASPVIDANVTLDADGAYTVAASGLLGSMDVTPVVLVDNPMPTVAGSSLVRFVHLSPDAPAVDVVVAGGGPTLFPNTIFRGFKDYASVAAGTYDLEVQLTSNGNVALTVPGLVLAGGTNYTVFATGLAAGTPALAALAVVDAQ